MRIIHIHRQYRPGAYSIENLFHSVADGLRRRGVTVIEYELHSPPRLFEDVRALRSLDADIYHITGDINYLVFFLPWKKTVLTVHDIGHYLFSLHGWKRLLYRWIWLEGPMRFARQVTAVSGATRTHIMEHLQISGDRIRIVENCFHPIYRPMPKTFNAECPRILQVGTNPNKNVPRLIYALEGIPCRLVLIGKLDSPIHAALEETGTVFENRVGIDQHALFQEYTAADLVAFVSINEGFGLPIIEAQAMGRPLVTSNIPPMSIIAGSGACLADPLSIKAIKKVILRLIEDEQCRRQVIIDGLKNVKEYTQSAVVEKYLTTYQTLPTGRFCVTPFIS